MTGFSAEDHRYMARALALAAKGLYTTQPNPRVGCVLVADDEVIGEGWHAVAGGAHAEIVALEAAGARARGATVYVSLEPCSHSGRTGPCAPVLADAGVSRVVVAMQDPNPAVRGEGMAFLRNAGIDVASGLMEQAACELNAGFVSRMSLGRPRVLIKLAASMDGRTAMARGESQWITGPEARDDVQRLRAASSAVVTGVGTVTADDPSLNVRSTEVDAGGRQPLRVVLDSDLRMSADARMLRLEGRTLIFTSQDALARSGPLQDAGAEVESLPRAAQGLDLKALLERLADLECNDVLVEAGATLCGSLVTAGLVDELVVYLAPHLMGDAARGMFCLPGLEKMADRVQLRILDVRSVGVDIRVRARPD